MEETQSMFGYELAQKAIRHFCFSSRSSVQSLQEASILVFKGITVTKMNS